MRSLILSILFFPVFAIAHPTAFRDSIGIMGYHSPALTHNQINYSFRHWFAVGAHHFTRPDKEDQHASFLSTNFLLKRWNGKTLQANVYAVVGAGSSELSGTAYDSGMGMLQFDIEDRKYYFLTKHQQVVNEEQTDLKATTFRFGLAPYVGDFEDFHSWIIFDHQIQQFSNESISYETTPMLRFFYQNLLFEIGQSFSGVTRFNYIAHF